MNCNICFSDLQSPIYEAASDQAITSLCELRPGRVRVWLCINCGHLCGEELSNTQNYYDSDYRLMLDHDDEDQIYEVKGNKNIYRTDHQVSTLLNKVNFEEGSKILDYGCAKGLSIRSLLVSRPDLHAYLFDVSSSYINYWQQFLPNNNWSIYETPAKWKGRFDVVTSFFALEHIPNLHNTVTHISDLLSVEGIFYGIVPFAFNNVADFVVIDHVNHFTKPSLHSLLHRAGFIEIDIDSDVHRGALVFKARKNGVESFCEDLALSINASHDLAKYWGNMGQRIRYFEFLNAGMDLAIYGSGFYGAYIASMLDHLGKVKCFLDANPYQQGKKLMGIPILPPEQLPNEIETLFIGLNPKISRTAAAEMDWLKGRKLNLVFFDEVINQ